MTSLGLKYVFVILHIITAAGWFGLAMTLSGQARLVLTVDAGAIRALADQTTRTVRLMGLFIILTPVFAITAFFLGGGFAAYGPPFHLSILLILVFVLIQFLVIHPAWTKLKSGVLADARPDVRSMTGLRKRIAAGVGVGHLLWLTLLVLMFWNVLVGSF